MDSKLQRYCDGLLEAGWLAAVVVTPLFFNIHSSRVFEPDKLTLLRSIAVFMAAIWLVKFIDRQGWRTLDWLGWRSPNSIWRMPFVLAVFLLAVVYLLSTVFSITPVVSWAGSYQRLQGTYTTLSYIVIFAMMLATIRSRDQVSRVITTIIVTSIPVSLYAMLQHYALDPLPWGGDTQQRVAGSMGNSIFIAAYIIMVVPLTLARIIDAFTNILTDEQLETADIVRSSIYIFALAIQLIAIIWTNSRGPFLAGLTSIWAFGLILLVTLRNARAGDRTMRGSDAGKSVALVLVGTLGPLLLVALVLSDTVSDLASFGIVIGGVAVLVGVILILALAGRAWSWLWSAWILLSVMLLGLIVVFNFGVSLVERYASTPLVGETVTEITAWRNLPQIGRFGRLLESERGSGRVRVLIWEGSLELLAPHDPLEKPDGQEDAFNFLRPILGYGPESMYVAYNRFYPPELATIEARNASPDRAHNETFDAVIITGAAGLLVWQFLYLSVFYYGFRWLGVVNSKMDRNVLIGLWIAGALLGGAVIAAVLGMPFIGVAVPFGAIAGLVIYLIYYAIFSRNVNGDEQENPFYVDRLIMIGLVAAVLAHYVEIHFGIAIAASRTHFFVYVALMFLVGYLLPKLKDEPAVETEPVKKRRRAKRLPSRGTRTGWTSPVLGAAFVLALIIGILAYDFMTFSLPAGESISSIEDVPTVGEIVHQSFFVNQHQSFAESPFIWLMLVLSWLLGTLLFLSELNKRGVIGLKSAPGPDKDNRIRRGAYALLAVALACAGAAIYSFLSRSDAEPGNVLARISFWLLLIYASLGLWSGLGLLQRGTAGRNAAGAVSLGGVALVIPALVSGGGVSAAVIGVLAAIALYLVWDRSWSDLYYPAAIVAIVSLVIGLSYTYLHALIIRNGILPPAGVTDTTAAVVRRVLEADQTAAILTVFYIFAFGTLFITGLALAWDSISSPKDWATVPGTLALIVLLPLAFAVVYQTNLKVIQADIVYKRADPWDKQAARDGDPALWDNAIAIYEHAIELAPREDFYYLWLGRAYLERSAVTEGVAEQEELLRTAEQRLIEAQRINPLNTDHTANLARLNTRWAEFAADQERNERVDIASDYYEAAMSLSPNNAVIINEYARLAFVLGQDCGRAIELFERSTERDPYYAATLFERYEVLRVCGDRQEEEAEKLRYYGLAAESLAEGLERDRRRPAQDWLQLAGLYVVLDQDEDAIAAYDKASEIRGDDLEQWRIDYTMADLFFQANQLDRAEAFGQLALDGAPAEVASQIQQFLDGIAATRGTVDG